MSYGELMSTEQDQARLLAERIARRVSPSGALAPIAPTARAEVGAELAAVRAGLSELQKKLTQIESRLRAEEIPAVSTAQAARSAAIPATHSPWLGGVNAAAAHPSQERFGIDEAVVSELVDFFQNEKTCGMEPGSKPCDHCEMCSSRGF